MKPTTVTLAVMALLAVASLARGDDDALRAIGQGRGIYLQHCASCHGPLGEGSGGEGTNGEPGAIPDLTRIEERDGRFDPVHVAVHIDGRRDGLKSESDMPCWNAAFRGSWPGGEGTAMLKVWKLARYLDFIQRRPPLDVVEDPEPER